MTLNRFRLFTAVARHLNVTKTSEELHVSQSSISQHLKLLQKEYGVKLYSKVAQGIELTQAGRIFLNNARAILMQIEDLKKNLSAGLPETQARSLTVGGSYAPSASFLPSLLAVFKKSHPLVQLTLRTSSSHAIERMVLESEAEIALITKTPRSPHITMEP